MKRYILILLVFSSFLTYSSLYQYATFSAGFDEYQNQLERRLTPSEVKQRGIDLLVNEIVEEIDEIDLEKMARSAIFETSYGFRWKMVNLHTGKKIIIKVDKDFKIISARTGKNVKIITP